MTGNKGISGVILLTILSKAMVSHEIYIISVILNASVTTTCVWLIFVYNGDDVDDVNVQFSSEDAVRENTATCTKYVIE